jgi:hypothetical protein
MRDLQGGSPAGLQGHLVEEEEEGEEEEEEVLVMDCGDQKVQESRDVGHQDGRAVCWL